MLFFTNMRVGSKLLLLTLVLLGFLVGMAAIGLYNVNAINNECNAMYDQDLTNLARAKDAKIEMVIASRVLLNMAITAGHAQREAQLPMHTKAIERVVSLLQSIRKDIADPAVGSLVEQAMAGIATVHAKQKEALTILLQTDATLESMGKAPGISKDAAIATDKLISQVAEKLELKAAERKRITDVMYDRSRMYSYGFLALALVCGVVLSLAIRAGIATPLQEVSRKASLVAAGNLDQVFILNRSDEIGSLAVSLERMVGNLRQRIAEAEHQSHEASLQSDKALEAMQQADVAKNRAESGQAAIQRAAANVEGLVSRVSSATEELSGQIRLSSSSTAAQRERIAEIATAMETMNAIVLDVARSAAKAAEGSERARKKAQEGEDIVRLSVEAMGRAQQDSLLLINEMSDLGKRAESIGAVMTVISDIADQTNLLALNAAIEAARAGEAGRGFAVVADEVRKLAEKSMNATRDVSQAIQGVQQGARRSVEAVDNSTHHLNETTALVKKSGVSLADIVHESVQMADQVRTIATAADTQSNSSQAITLSLEEVNTMSADNARAVAGSDNAVAELVRQTMEMQALVADLRKQ